ncbi:hypothetical protein M0804_007554 [Polistes exclamans]|nr:hypothetical protein M0804_007554 [Polistes exclamans]
MIKIYTLCSQIYKKKKCNHVIKEVVHFIRELDLEVNSDDVNKLLNSHSIKLTIDELIEMREQNVTDASDTSDPVPSDKHMTIAILTESLRSVKKSLQIFKNVDSNKECITIEKQKIK